MGTIARELGPIKTLHLGKSRMRVHEVLATELVIGDIIVATQAIERNYKKTRLGFVNISVTAENIEELRGGRRGFHTFILVV